MLELPVMAHEVGHILLQSLCFAIVFLCPHLSHHLCHDSIDRYSYMTTTPILLQNNVHISVTSSPVQQQKENIPANISSTRRKRRKHLLLYRLTNINIVDTYDYHWFTVHFIHRRKFPMDLLHPYEKINKFVTEPRIRKPFG